MGAVAVLLGGEPARLNRTATISQNKISLSASGSHNGGTCIALNTVDSYEVAVGVRRWHYASPIGSSHDASSARVLLGWASRAGQCDTGGVRFVVAVIDHDDGSTGAGEQRPSGGGAVAGRVHPHRSGRDVFETGVQLR